MSEKTVFETYRDEMLKITESIAKPLGATVQESDNDEYGFQFTSEREDGNILIATLTVTPSTQGKEAGNFILRANGDDETVVNWGPDNHTDRCWAPYADNDAWSGKLDKVRAHVSEFVEKIQAWQSAISPKP